VPLLLIQGAAGTLVPPAVTRAYATGQCNGDSPVRLIMLPDEGHGFVARDAAGVAVNWMAERFASHPVPEIARPCQAAGTCRSRGTGSLYE